MSAWRWWREGERTHRLEANPRASSENERPKAETRMTAGAWGSSKRDRKSASSAFMV